MSDILMTNIFFMITAIASIIITLLLAVFIVYGIKVIKKINRITTVVEHETLNIISDVEEVRNVVRQNVTLVKNVTSAVFLKKLIEQIFNSRRKK